MIRKLLFCIAPIAVLLVSITIACLLGYMLLMGLGDVLSIKTVVNKGTQLFLLLSIFPLMAVLKLHWREIGFTGKKLFCRQFGQGVVTGLLILGPIILLLYYLQIRELDATKIWTVFYILKKLMGAFITALLISLIEEPLFRGILLAAMRKRLGLLAGIIISACYYAGLHFLKTDLFVPYAELQWFSAFTLVGDAFANLFEEQHLQAFLALFMVGVFLNVARLKAGLSLGFCIGCHTGWVFLIKMTKTMSNVNVNADYFFLVSHYDGVIGPLVSLWLMLTIIGYLIYNRYGREQYNCT